MFLDGDFEAIARGYNDGIRISISSSSLAAMVVEIHEATHGRIFDQTFDGQLHRMIIAAEAMDWSDNRSQIYLKSSKILFNDTRTAHEAGATYLSIQALKTSQERRESFKELNKEYRAYYNILSSIVDPIAKTSWMRYATAWSLIHWAFNSKRLELFFSETFPNIDLLLQVDSPSRRLEIAQTYLRKSNRARKWYNESLSSAKTEYLSTGRKLWRIESEFDCDKHGTLEDVQLFENIFTAHAGDWLVDNVPIETADFANPDLNFGPGYQSILDKAGVTPEQIFTSPQSVLSKEWRETNISRQALMHANDIIEHETGCLIERLDSEDAIKMANACHRAASSSDYCTILSDETDESRIVLAFRKANHATHANNYSNEGTISLDIDLAIAILKAIKLRIPDFEFRCIIKSNRTKIKNRIDILSNIYASIYPDASYPHSNPIILYMTGPWPQVYEINDVALYSRPVLFMDRLGDEGKPLWIKIAKVGSSSTYLINAKSRWAGVKLNEYEHLLSSRGELKLWECDDEEFENVILPLKDAWHIWRTF